LTDITLIALVDKNQVRQLERDLDVFKERTLVEKAIAGYFTELYRIADHILVCKWL
jgi:hypothetical protein